MALSFQTDANVLNDARESVASFWRDRNEHIFAQRALSGQDDGTLGVQAAVRAAMLTLERIAPQTGEDGSIFRVGRSVPRNVYKDDEPMFMAADAGTAATLAGLLNMGAAYLAQGLAAAAADPTPQPRPDAEGQGAALRTALRTALGEPFLTCHAGGERTPFVRLKYASVAEAQRAHEAILSFLLATPPAPDAIRQPAGDRVTVEEIVRILDWSLNIAEDRKPGHPSEDGLPLKIVGTEEAAEAIIARIATAETGGSGWLPIETAPKDGTHILGYGLHETRGHYIGDVQFWNGNWTVVWMHGYSAPTDWQPLPPPPSPRIADPATPSVGRDTATAGAGPVETGGQA